MAAKGKDDLGQAEVQNARDKAREQGYEGVKASPIPNSEFTLASGPGSPSAADQLRTAAQQRDEDQKEA